ncbi:hypothetical protein [Methylobacterium marchantiae]|uniref:Bacteriocin leader domain-containing protein n=1 Tax=Methylobacterium marchantiae TaxID=600331 RepID=A0ABW3X4R4_9HYPH|nr:hypothetical protein AIGOOFII_4110 [Methylobacterium marchantiae]
MKELKLDQIKQIAGGGGPCGQDKGGSPPPPPACGPSKGGKSS